MSALDWLGAWAIFSGFAFLMMGVVTLMFGDDHDERRLLARATLASPLWPLLPLVLAVLMVR